MDINTVMQKLGITRKEADILDKMDGTKDGQITEDIFTVAKNRKVQVDKSILQNDRQGYDGGGSVASNLIGYTTKNDQKEVINTIQNDVNNDNVMFFIKGFEDARLLNHDKEKTVALIFQTGLMELGGQSFFTQLQTEDKFQEKNDLIRNVGLKLKNYLMANGYINEASQVNEILQHSEITKEDAENLDRISVDYIKFEM